MWKTTMDQQQNACSSSLIQVACFLLLNRPQVVVVHIVHVRVVAKRVVRVLVRAAGRPEHDRRCPAVDLGLDVKRPDQSPGHQTLPVRGFFFLSLKK